MNQNLWQILAMLESMIPVAEVIHSLHVQAMRVPEVRNDPAMQRFTDVSMHNLHAMVAAAGYIRRYLSGDRSPLVLEGLKEQLGVWVRTTNETRSAFTQLFSKPEARKVESLQAMSQVLGLWDQGFRAMTPIVRPLVGPEVYTGAH